MIKSITSTEETNELNAGLLRELSQWSLDQIPDEQLTEKDWPLDYAYRNKGPIELTTQAYQWGKVGEIRTTDIHSDRLSIVNMMFYPNQTSQLPIYAMEIVKFGKKAVIGVVDMKWVEAIPEENWCELAMSQIHENDGPFSYVQEPPQWYCECRSGYDFILKPSNNDEFEASIEVHKKLWRTLKNQIKSIENEFYDGSINASFELQKYKTHHRMNTPGLPFLKKTFGHDWTTSYLDLYYG